jgi:ribosome biogenesis protein SSF1/2
MGRRGSQRKKQSVADKQAAKKPAEGNPKSMVIRIGAGDVGSSVSQLVQDMRQLMQPDTAVRLKVPRLELAC